MKRKKPACRHDHKNAIQIGNIDFVCPLCHNLIDPLEWFLMNSFTFVDVEVQKEKQPSNARKQIESKTGKRAVSRYNFKTAQEQKELKGK